MLVNEVSKKYCIKSIRDERYGNVIANLTIATIPRHKKRNLSSFPIIFLSCKVTQKTNEKDIIIATAKRQYAGTAKIAQERTIMLNIKQ